MAEATTWTQATADRSAATSRKRNSAVVPCTSTLPRAPTAELAPPTARTQWGWRSARDETLAHPPEKQAPARHSSRGRFHFQPTLGLGARYAMSISTSKGAEVCSVFFTWISTKALATPVTPVIAGFAMGVHSLVGTSI